MDKKEREDIINEAVEKAVLIMPEIIGNLMMSYSLKMKEHKKFYELYPEFEKYREIVAAAVERIEDQDFSKSMSEILKEAVPEIRRNIKSVKDLDMTTVKRPSLDFSQGEF